MLVKKINAYFVNRNEKVAEFGAMETLKIEQMNSFKNILIAFLIFLSSSVFGQAVGDFVLLLPVIIMHLQPGEFGMAAHGQRHRVEE